MDNNGGTIEWECVVVWNKIANYTHTQTHLHTKKKHYIVDIILLIKQKIHKIKIVLQFLINRLIN